jgi:hypothetical protein
MSGAIQYADWMKADPLKSDYCIHCGAPIDQSGEYQESAATVQGVGLGYVLRGVFETMRSMSDGDRFILSEKICAPATSCDELARRFSVRYGRAITRQAIHKKVTKLARKLPELRAFLNPSGKFG